MLKPLQEATKSHQRADVGEAGQQRISLSRALRACDRAPHPPTEGGNISADRGKGNWRGGFRVFKLHVSSENLPKLKQLFQDFADGKARTRGVLYYRDEWMAEWDNVLKMREEAGKRTVPNPPAALLLVRFVSPDGSVRGNNAAPCVIDLRIRIPSYSVSVPLRGASSELCLMRTCLTPDQSSSCKSLAADSCA